MSNNFLQDGTGDKSSTRLCIIYVLLFDTVIICSAMFWQKDIPTNAYNLLSTINGVLLGFGLTKGAVENTKLFELIIGLFGNKKKVKNDNTDSIIN